MLKANVPLTRKKERSAKKKHSRIESIGEKVRSSQKEENDLTERRLPRLSLGTHCVRSGTSAIHHPSYNETPGIDESRRSATTSQGQLHCNRTTP
jgi:hypothetical protein